MGKDLDDHPKTRPQEVCDGHGVGIASTISGWAMHGRVMHGSGGDDHVHARGTKTPVGTWRADGGCLVARRGD